MSKTLNSFAKIPPTLDDLRAMAEEALAEMPDSFRRPLGPLAINVDDFPDEETMEEMGCQTEFDLLGLYRGVDLTRKSGFDAPSAPDMIFLYRRPILDFWCETGESLPDIVRHVLIHEIGHHYGFSDADMEAIEASADL